MGHRLQMLGGVDGEVGALREILREFSWWTLEARREGRSDEGSNVSGDARLRAGHSSCRGGGGGSHRHPRP